MKNTSSLARYMMMNNGKKSPDYPRRDYPTRQPMQPANQRRTYDNPSYDTDMRHEDVRRGEVMDNYDDEWLNNYGGEPHNDSQQRIIGFAAASNGKNAASPMNYEIADEWMSKIINEDGTKGAHWSMDDVKRLMQQRGVECDPIKLWVAMNAEYSDRQKVNKKYGVDRPEYYMDAAIAFWLKDADAVKDKLSAYYTYVVKH